MPDQSGFPRTKKPTYQDHPADGARARVTNISEHHGKILVISYDLGQYADANKNEHLMITDPSTNSGLTRRSFIKRSVVAAVAVSSMTIFSGLVNAAVITYGTYSVPSSCSSAESDSSIEKDKFVTKINGVSVCYYEYKCPDGNNPGAFIYCQKVFDGTEGQKDDGVAAPKNGDWYYECNFGGHFCRHNHSKKKPGDPWPTN